MPAGCGRSCFLHPAGEDVDEKQAVGWEGRQRIEPAIARSFCGSRSLPVEEGEMDGQRKATRSRTRVPGTGRTLWELRASDSFHGQREH